MTVVILGLALAIIVLDSTIVNVALPSIQHDFAVSVVGLEWIGATYSLVFGAFILIWGRLGDQFGRKRIFACGITVFMAGSLLTGASTDLTVMLIGRIVQGFGAAMASPSTLSILTTSFRGRNRGIAFGIWGAIAGAAGALGPLVGGYLTTYASWRWSFLINIPIGIVALVGAYVFVAESKSPEKYDPDLLGAILIALGLGPIIFGLVQGQNLGWVTPAQPFSIFGWQWPLSWISITPVAILLGGAFSVGFVLCEFRRLRANRMVLFDFSLLSQFKAFRYGLITVAVVSMGEFGVFFILSLYLQLVRGLSAVSMGISLLPFAGVSFFVAPIAGILSNRYGARRIVTIGMVFESVSLIVMSRVIGIDTSVIVLQPILVLYGAGVGLAIGQLTSTVLSDIPMEHAGMGSGANSTVRQLGSAFGIALIGAVLTTQIAATGTAALGASSLIPESIKPTIQAALNSGLGGGLASIPNMPSGPLAAAIAAVFYQAITEGTRSAALVAGVFCGLGAVTSLLIPKTRRGVAETVSATTGSGRARVVRVGDVVHHPRQNEESPECARSCTDEQDDARSGGKDGDQDPSGIHDPRPIRRSLDKRSPRHQRSNENVNDGSRRRIFRNTCRDFIRRRNELAQVGREERPPTFFSRWHSSTVAAASAREVLTPVLAELFS
jgi:EmrB/QacA subfamily drug resistance transporter